MLPEECRRQEPDAEKEITQGDAVGAAGKQAVLAGKHFSSGEPRTEGMAGGQCCLSASSCGTVRRVERGKDKRQQTVRSHCSWNEPPWEESVQAGTLQAPETEQHKARRVINNLDNALQYPRITHMVTRSFQAGH